MSHVDVTKLREQIPTTGRMTYLNTGWAGPSPVSVVEAIARRLEYESYNGPTSVNVLESGEAIDLEAREAVARLIGASADEILLTSSTTDGINTVMTGLPWREGDEIITCNLEHSSILLPSYQQQRLRGVKVNVLTFAPGESRDSILSKVEGALTARTRMVFFSHVEYSTGLRMPVEGIRKLTAGRGIWMLIDGAQGAGHVPVDVGEIDCDFYAMPGQKWLLGPDGTGALYIRRSMIPHIEPVRVSGKWVTSYDHDGGVEPDTSNIDKFIVGTSSAPLRAGFTEGIRFVSEVGLAAIEERALALAAMLKERLAAMPHVEVLSPVDGPGRSGLTTFTVAGRDPEETAQKLWDTHRIVIRDVKYPSCLRASLDFFNTEEEVDMLADAVRSLA